MAEKKKNRYGLWFIVILLLVGLAGFGTGGFGTRTSSLGTVGSKEISVLEYQNAVDQERRALSRQFQTQLTFQQAQQFGAGQSALGRLVQTRTLENEASELGLSAGDAAVFDQLQSTPEFQGAGGTFDRERYRLALREIGQSEEQFESAIRDSMARTLLQLAVIGGVPEIEPYADVIVEFTGETRDITWATVEAQDLDAPLPSPSDDSLLRYYEENPEPFTLPETRGLTYVWLTPNMLQDQMTVPETAIEDLYQERISDFVQPERRLVERLVYISESEAADAFTRLSKGETSFEDLVVERGESLSDIDLGDVDIGSLGAAGEAVFAAETGAVVGPFNSSLGPALFRINAVLAAQETPFSEVRDDLRNELAADAARRVIRDSSEQITDLLAGGATLEDLAERTDLKLETIEWTEATADGIAAYEGFRRAAAGVEQGAYPEILDLSDGGIFALRLDTIKPPALQPFAEVRDQVVSGWTAFAQQEAVVAAAQKIADEILPLTDFKTLELDPTSESGLTRRSFVEGTPPQFNETIFAMNVGEVTVLDAGDRAIIVRLEAIAPADQSSETTIALRKQLQQEAAEGIAQDMFNAYRVSVQERTEININQATLNAANTQFQ